MNSRPDYHRIERVGDPFAGVLQANPRLEILWYPVAAPELNPQEQVWKATRREVSHNHSQLRLAPLTAQFENHLVSTRFTSAMLEHYDNDSVRAMLI